MSFRKYREALHIEREYPLTKEPPRMDFLVIKKEKDTVIDNAVGRMFRKHNVIDYSLLGTLIRCSCALSAHTKFINEKLFID